MFATAVSAALRSRSRRLVAAACLVVALPCAAAPAYDFAYRVSGDRRVAPQQVFDDGATTYIQFHPGQVLPALLTTSADGAQRLLAYAQMGPYVTVAGTHASLVAQMGNVRAVVDYAGQAPRVGEPVADTAAPAIAPPMPSTTPSPVSVGELVEMPGRQDPPARPARVSATPRDAGAARPSTVSARAVSSPGAPPTASASPAAWSQPVVAARTDRVGEPATVPAERDAGVVAGAWPLDAPAYEASLADQNLRRALARWATQAGWTFRPEHWTPDVDIAVSAPASFGPDFKTAVRGLLAGTELSSRPLQPCFYANQVLRVVPQAERCDRRVAH